MHHHSLFELRVWLIGVSLPSNCSQAQAGSQWLQDHCNSLARCQVAALMLDASETHLQCQWTHQMLLSRKLCEPDMSLLRGRGTGLSGATFAVSAFYVVSP